MAVFCNFFYYCLVIYNRRTMQPLPFQQFANSYTVISQLGRGASGICYRIMTIKDRKEFALKKIPLHLVDPNKLNSELTLLSSIQHPNMIRLHHSFISKDFLYLLFEYNQQKDLQKTIKERERTGIQFEQTQLWAFLKQILEALIYLHQRAIMHRDIKPSNIFVDKEGGLQLGDLGSAKFSEKQNYTRIGTPFYLAPEIIKYESYTEKVDIWSLGVTIYQLAALKMPFHHPNFLKLAQSITYQEPQYQFHYSKRLKACIAQMLRKDPKGRPSAQDLLDRYFITPIETPPFQEQQMVQSEQPSLHSVQLEAIQQAQQVQVEVEQLLSQWNGMRQQGRLFSKITSKKNIHRGSIDQEPQQQQIGPSPRVSSIKTLKRTSSNRLCTREDEIRETSALQSKSHFEDGDDTIVLQVNPNDCSNFCGFYRETPRPSRIYFAQSDSNNPFKMGRKSSLFKQTPEPQIQNPSHFKTNHTFKQNKSFRLQPRRKESAIGARQKHGELMSGLRPSRHGKDEDDTQEIVKPQLIVIDIKHLLLPCSEVIQQF